MNSKKESIICSYPDFAIFLKPYFKNKKEISDFFNKCFLNKKTQEMWASLYYFSLAYVDLVSCKSSKNNIAYLNLILIGLVERIHSIKIGKKESLKIGSKQIIIRFFRNTPKEDKKMIEEKIRPFDGKAFKFSEIIAILYNRRNQLAHGKDFWWSNHIFCPFVFDYWITHIEYGSRKNKKFCVIETSLRVKDFKNLIVKTAIIDIKRALRIK